MSAERSAPERAIVIGAGVSGLCAGTYLRRSGYAVDLFEAHDLPGGVCTSWTRGDYTLDGCLHWMAGSSPASQFHALWSEVVDMESIQWVDHEVVVAVEHTRATAPDGDPVFTWYADPDRLEAYLLSVAPEDEAFIRRLVGDIRWLSTFQVPNLTLAPQLQTWWDKLPTLPMLLFLLRLWRWGRHTNQDMARRVRSPFLAEALERLYGDQPRPMLMALFPRAWFACKGAGYPIGGSLAFARRLEQRLTSLGGQVHYRSRVARILVQDHQAVGIELADGTQHRADVVLSAADGRWTLYEALSGEYLHDLHRAAYEGEALRRFPSLLYISLGVRRSFAGQPQLRRFSLREPLVLPDGTRVDYLSAHSCAHDPTLAPPGCTVLNIMVETRAFGWWSELRASDRPTYKAAKDQVARLVIDTLEPRMGPLAEHVEVVDVATPATWHRYTSNWEGAYEGWLSPVKLQDARLPNELPGLQRFAMCGQWVEPGGGVPQALTSARNAVQVLCHRQGVPFMGQG